MKRRRLILGGLSIGLVGVGSGCLSDLHSNVRATEITEVEVWNADDSGHTFQVSVFDTNGEKTYQRSIELEGASGNRVTREVLSDAPDTAAEVRARVDDKTDEKTLDGYERPVQLSIKYNADQQLAIVDFV
ncbi:hypothetical protein [Salinirubrum litoreum]|uniref:Uncharacterized protein n=1 Tax=Salinirubrum litoreum TaxID=1126234 RepID=A0ABD5R9Y8_9EURY|nr:hypothetical protein [Salinirubrum litoreum]